MRFWATEYIKTASGVERALGHMAAGDPSGLGALVANNTMQTRFEQAGLTPEEQLTAERDSGFLSGLRSGAYTALGAGIGTLAGSGAAPVLQRVPGVGRALAVLAPGLGLVAGGYTGARAAGNATAEHRLREALARRAQELQFV